MTLKPASILTALLVIAATVTFFAPAPAGVVFSGFASGTLWLVLGGLVIAEGVNRTGLGERFARFMLGRFVLSYRALVAAVVIVSSALCFVMVETGLSAALMAPLAGHFAEAAGWPLKAALMTMALGFTTLIMPFQAPPVLVGVQVAGIALRTTLRLSVPLMAVSLLVLLPLDYLWWRLIGYFG